MNSPFNFSSVFSNLPADLRNNLERTYSEIIRNYKENRFEPSELNGGKFSETVYRILEWHTDANKNHTPFGTPINNFEDYVKKFISLTQFPDSIRFHIPKLISSIYSIRNKRGVGHIGGDINPNVMDATLVVQVSKWVLAELIRIFHSIPIIEAQTIVEKLIIKEYPIVWSVLNKKRVLDVSLTFENKILVLLYSESPNPVTESNLLNWLEHSNSSVFRNNILIPLHKKRLIEYDVESHYVFLSPKGIKFVEDNINLLF